MPLWRKVWSQFNQLVIWILVVDRKDDGGTECERELGWSPGDIVLKSRPQTPRAQ